MMGRFWKRTQRIKLYVNIVRATTIQPKYLRFLYTLYLYAHNNNLYGYIFW